MIIMLHLNKGFYKICSRYFDECRKITACESFQWNFAVIRTNPDFLETIVSALLSVRSKNQTCGVEVEKFTTNQKKKNTESFIKHQNSAHYIFRWKEYCLEENYSNWTGNSHSILSWRLKHLIAEIRTSRPKCCDPETWRLLHDNAPNCNLTIVR